MRGEHPVGVLKAAQNTETEYWSATFALCPDSSPLSVSSPTLHRQWKQAEPSHGLPSSTQLRLCRRKHIFLCLGMFLPTTKSLCHCVRHASTLTKLFWTLSNSTSLSFFMDQIASSFSNLGRLLTFTLQITSPLSKFRLATWGFELTILAVNLKPMEAGSIWKTWPIIWVPSTFLLVALYLPPLFWKSDLHMISI